jgi:hypothetical protein
MGFGLVNGFTGHLQMVTTSNYSTIANSHTLQFTTARTSLLSLLYLHCLSPDNGFQRVASSVSVFTSLLAGDCLTTTPTLLTVVSRLSCNSSCSSFYSLGTDYIENTYHKISSVVASRSYRLDRVQNTIPLLLFTAIT